MGIWQDRLNAIAEWIAQTPVCYPAAWPGQAFELEARFRPKGMVSLAKIENALVSSSATARRKQSVDKERRFSPTIFQEIEEQRGQVSRSSPGQFDSPKSSFPTQAATS